MFKKILILLFILSSNAYAQTGTTAPMFGLDQCLWFENQAGTVVNNYCAKMIVTGTLTDNGDGSFTLDSDGGGGGTGDIESVGDCLSGNCFDGVGFGTTLTGQLTADTIDFLEDNYITFGNNDSAGIGIRGKNLDSSDTDFNIGTYGAGRIIIGEVDDTRILLTTEPTGNVTVSATLSINGTLDVGNTTTAVNNADAKIGVSAANQIGLVVQTKATPTKPAFEIQTSAGRPAVRFETAGNSNLRINYSGTMADAGFAGFGLSVQNINDAGEGSWIEILNSGGANTGAFFGMFGNQFQLFNWQGGDIEFWTFPTASNGYPRVTMSDTGNMGLDGAPQFGWGHGWGGGVGVFALANVSTAPTTSLTTALAMYSKSQELYYMGPSNQERKVAYHAPTASIPINPGSMVLTGTLAITGDSTQGAQIDGYNSYVLLFDATTDEGAAYRFKLPSNWSAHSSLRLNYSMTSATANEVEWEAAVMCITPTTDSIRDDADSFAAFATAVDTVRATARYEDTVSITLTDDSCAAGDDMVINISTDSDDATNDDATGDRRLIGATYIYTVF